MEKIIGANEIRFHDDGTVTVETEHGMHISGFNGERWSQNFVDKQTGVHIGSLDPKVYGQERVDAMLQGRAELPEKISPVADIWYDLGRLRELAPDKSLMTLFRVDEGSLTALGQVLWEALAMCSLANAAEDGETPNQLALTPWDRLGPTVHANYKAGALEMLKFLASAADSALEIGSIVDNPPWRKHFPLSNPAPSGYEAHMLHQIVSCPPLPRA